MDIFTPEKRSEIMRGIPNKNTKPELLMRKTLHALGLRYRLHDRKLPGTPDIIFRKNKVAVFVDGDWWHGRNYETDSNKYPPLWQEKIKANMARDVKVNEQLESAGWKVFRVWQKDLQKEPVKHARYIYEYIRS
jgi:DNA mismatch endonuclease (patch repair protein)